jgi:hypothetical protein
MVDDENSATGDFKFLANSLIESARLTRSAKKRAGRAAQSAQQSATDEVVGANRAGASSEQQSHQLAAQPPQPAAVSGSAAAVPLSDTQLAQSTPAYDPPRSTWSPFQQLVAEKFSTPAPAAPHAAIAQQAPYIANQADMRLTSTEPIMVYQTEPVSKGPQPIAIVQTQNLQNIPGLAQLFYDEVDEQDFVADNDPYADGYDPEIMPEGTAIELKGTPAPLPAPLSTEPVAPPLLEDLVAGAQQTADITTDQLPALQFFLDGKKTIDDAEEEVADLKASLQMVARKVAAVQGKMNIGPVVLPSLAPRTIAAPERTAAMEIAPAEVAPTAAAPPVVAEPVATELTPAVAHEPMPPAAEPMPPAAEPMPPAAEPMPPAAEPMPPAAEPMQPMSQQPLQHSAQEPTPALTPLAQLAETETINPLAETGDLPYVMQIDVRAVPLSSEVPAASEPAPRDSTGPAPLPPPTATPTAAAPPTAAPPTATATPNATAMPTAAPADRFAAASLSITPARTSSVLLPPSADGAATPGNSAAPAQRPQQNQPCPVAPPLDRPFLPIERPPFDYNPDLFNTVVAEFVNAGQPAQSNSPQSQTPATSVFQHAAFRPPFTVPPSSSPPPSTTNATLAATADVGAPQQEPVPADSAPVETRAINWQEPSRPVNSSNRALVISAKEIEQQQPQEQEHTIVVNQRTAAERSEQAAVQKSSQAQDSAAQPATTNAPDATQKLPAQFVKFGPYDVRPAMGHEVPIGRGYQPVPYESISRLAGYIGLDEYSLYIREVPYAPNLGLKPSRNGIWVRQPGERKYRRLEPGQAERITADTEVRVGGDGKDGSTGLLLKIH